MRKGSPPHQNDDNSVSIRNKRMLFWCGGQSLIEIFIALGVGILIIGGVTGSFVVIARNNDLTGKTRDATITNDSLLDSSRSFTEGNWTAIYALNKGSANTYSFTNSTNVTMTNYGGTGTSPVGIAFDGTNMWTANADGYSITKITPTGAMTTYGTGPWPTLPYSIAFDGTNMWTANNIGNSVTKITPAGATTTYSVLAGPVMDIAYNSITGDLWTANGGDINGSVTKVNKLTGAAQTYTRDIGPNPYLGAYTFSAIAFNYNTGDMWTANNNASVTKISSAGVMTNYTGIGVSESYPDGQATFDIAFDGTNMWTANFPDTVSKITPAGVITNYNWPGNSPAGIAFDGTYMWTANNNDNSVTRISPSGAMTTYPGDLGYPYGIAFDGTNMWTTSSSYNRVTKIAPIVGPLVVQAGTEPVIIGNTTYSRSFYVDNVSRDGSGNIESVYNVANDDPSTQKITVETSFTLGTSVKAITSAFYATRSQDFVVQQTDWSGGSGQAGPMTGANGRFSSSANVDFSNTPGSISPTIATCSAASEQCEIVSSIYDTGLTGGAGFNSFMWQGSQPSGSRVQFKLAVSNSAGGPWNYGASIAPVGPNIQSAIDQSLYNNARYFQYKIIFDTAAATPTVDDVIISLSR